jgi:hypothetical protein
VFAAITWFAGGISLGAKGTSLAVLLAEIDTPWRWFAPGIGIVAGLLKKQLLFNHFCQRNLDRIAALESPRIWQFFRPGFFPALAVMISCGALMSRAAVDSFGWLVFTVALDISLAIALLGSSHKFFLRPVQT